MLGPLHFLVHWTGGFNASGPIYLEWSGFVSDLTLFTAITVWYKRHRCKSCWRIAHHRVHGTHYKTCHKHMTSREHDKIRMEHEKAFPDQHRFLEEEGDY